MSPIVQVDKLFGTSMCLSDASDGWKNDEANDLLENAIKVFKISFLMQLGSVKQLFLIAFAKLDFQVSQKLKISGSFKLSYVIKNGESQSL